MPENRFVDDVARHYDDVHAAAFDPDVVEPTVERIVELAGGGAVLEFAIGTGRIALPLARRGVRVTGIELSADMIAVLRAKPGGDELEVIEGDMATASAPGDYSLVVLAFNTIGNLTTRDEQARCFVNAARHLSSGGRFVIDVGLPTSELIDHGVRVFAITDDHIGVDELVDADTQRFRSRHLRRGDDGRWDEFSHPFRYVHPDELDVMARDAGLRLEHRWADWQRTQFTDDSRRHVSVWTKDHPT